MAHLKVLPLLFPMAMVAFGAFDLVGAQIADRAVITGLITDVTGAAVPGAKLTFIDEATGTKTTTGTNAAGNYSSPDLILGTYTVQVEKEGFETFVRRGLTLTGGQHYRQDVQLELGTVTQRVEVTTAPEMIQSETATVSNTVGQSYYEELPAVMGADIRLAEALLQVQPGYIPTAPNGDPIFRGSQFRSRINGGQTMATENWFDGAAFGYGEGHQQTQESSLPYSSVKEMTVVGSTFSAQYGHTSGGFVQYVTKSGTSNLHGQLYDFFTSHKLDARNFFLPDRLPLTQNNWGIAVGGPVVIPRVYNGRSKTFFFTNFDALDYHTAVNIGYFNTLPLLPQRQGDFSALLHPNNVIGHDALGRPLFQGEIFNSATTRLVNGVPVRDGYGFDPVTGMPIPAEANIIPAGDHLRSQVAARYVPLIPQPDRQTLELNEFGGFFGDTKLNVKTWLVRVDHTINDRLQLSNTFFMNHRPRIANCGGPGGCDTQFDGESEPEKNDTYIGSGFFQRITNKFDHLQLDWVMKPTIFNHTTLAYDRWVMTGHSLSGGVGWPQRLGITGLVDNDAGPPNVNLVGVIPYSSYGAGWYSDGSDINNRYQFLDDLTWIAGKHAVKAGFEYRYMQFPQKGWAQGTGGFFNFIALETGGYDATGNNLTQTGDPFASLLLGQVHNAGFTIPAFYRPTQKYAAPWINDEIKVTPRLTLTMGFRLDWSSGLYEQFDRFSTFSASTPNPGAGGYFGAVIFAGSGPGHSGKTSFEDPSWNAGPRFGVAYRLNEKTVVRGGYGIYYAGVPASLYNPYPVDGFQTNPTAPNLTNGLFPAFYWDTGFPAQNVQTPPIIDPAVDNGTSPVAVAPDGMLMPRYQNWSFAFERQLTTNVALDVAYVGNHATRLIAGSTFAGTASNMNNPSVLKLGPALLQADINSQQAQTAGIQPPYPGFQGDVAQALRPWPQYQTITWRNLPIGTSHYNALQVLLQRRMSQGLQFRIAYTWSKLINNGADDGQGGGGPPNGIQNPVDIQGGERSVSYDDVPHYLGIAWIYELPFGPEKKFGGGTQGTLAKLIGGWQLSAIQVYQSGRPIGVGMANDMGGFLFNYNKRPNKVGPGVNPNFTNPQTPYLLASGWADPGPLTFGNAPRMDPHVRGFAYYNEDWAIFKDTHVTESKYLRFEADVGNVFNRVYFCPVNANWSDPIGFGTTGSQCNLPRQIQFGLTLNF